MKIISHSQPAKGYHPKGALYYRSNQPRLPRDAKAHAKAQAKNREVSRNG